MSFVFVRVLSLACSTASFRARRPASSGLTSKVEKLHRTESYETPGGDHAARVDVASAPAKALTIAFVRELTTE